MDISDFAEFAKKIDTALALLIALVLVLAGAASVSVTRRTVGRIETINATSRLIMQSGLDKCSCDFRGGLRSVLRTEIGKHRMEANVHASTREMPISQGRPQQ